MKIFNNSLQCEVFLEKLKVAKVKPVLKSGKKIYLQKSYLQSVLPWISKILERIMYDRLYNYLNENNLFFQRQLGFRVGHPTEHALTEVIDNIYDSFNQNTHALRCLEFSIYKIKLRNRVTQNDVTLPVNNSKDFINVFLPRWQLNFVKC